MFSPYSSARAGNVATWDEAASWKKTAHVSPSGSGTSASTTRAPSDSSLATCASAESQAGGRSRASICGRLAQETDRQPVQPRLGHRPRREQLHDISATSATVRAIGPTVSSVGQSG